VRTALKVAGDYGTLGRSLRDLGRLALRTGKRARSETGIDRLGLSLVSVGIEISVERLTRTAPPPSTPPLTGLRVLVVGAGAMSGLAVATAARAGAERVIVANRTRAKAERLAAAAGGVVVEFTDLAAAIAQADLVISCTGAAKPVITEKIVQDVLSGREQSRRLVLLDLAMPRDVAPTVAELTGPDGRVSVIDMEALRRSASMSMTLTRPSARSWRKSSPSTALPSAPPG
jgi:glutamyl-tRNA reductase